VKFSEIIKIAEENAGGKNALLERLPEIPNQKDLLKISDEECLSIMSFRVFSTGLNQKMVRNKWEAFEEVFHGFIPRKIAFMSDEDLEKLMQDSRIIRHWGKIKATRDNGTAMVKVAEEFGSFGKYLKQWPQDDIIGLWDDVKKRFSQMGGNSGPYLLRWIGKDSFILTGDVIKALNDLGIADGKLTAKRDRVKVQAAFNAWHKETGLPYTHISRILAIYTG
jgi:3-methyladenine DNA glycosylase Tag